MYRPPVASASAVEVVLRIAETVDMVDAEPVESAVADQFQHERVGLGEDLWILDPYADEGLDVEEPAVVELLTGGTPERQSVVLPAEQCVEPVDICVDGGKFHVDRRGDLVVGLAEGLQFGAQLDLPGMAFGHHRIVGYAHGRQCGEFLRNGRQLGRTRPPSRRAECLVEGRRRHGQLVVVVADDERAADAGQAQFAGLEHPAVVVAEHRYEHGERGPVVRALPVDVEVAREPAGRTVFQDVPPPPVGPVDGHVVGHDVEYLTQPGGTKGPDQASMPGRAAPLRVQSLGVDHVVPVSAARSRLKVGRAVQVCDTERGDVVGQLRRLVEAEAAVQLHPIGRTWSHLALSTRQHWISAYRRDRDRFRPELQDSTCGW